MRESDRDMSAGERPGRGRMDPFTLDLPADCSAPRLARAAVSDHLGEHPRRDDLLLCVSEVVTNAVLHAGSASQLRVRTEGGRLVVEVVDGSPTLPARRQHDLQAPTGRGLRLLDALTVGWGTSPSESGKIVWFEFDLDQGRAEADGGPGMSTVELGGTAQPPPPGADGDRAVTITVQGALDLEQVPSLREELLGHVDAGARHIVVDLAACDFLDSTGISLLVTTHLRLAAEGGGLALANLTPQVAAVIELAGLDEMIR